MQITLYLSTNKKSSEWLFSLYNPILEHTGISEMFLCIEAALEFPPNFHQWRPVQTQAAEEEFI